MPAGILSDSAVMIVDIKWHGTTAVELLFRSREPELAIVSVGRTLSLSGADLSGIHAALRTPLDFLTFPLFP